MPLFDVKYGLPTVGVWWRLWQVFLRDEGERWMLEERVRTGGRLAHTSYLPHSGIQSGQGQGDGEGGAHTGGDQSNLGVKPAFWAPCKHCQLVDSRT